MEIFPFSLLKVEKKETAPVLLAERKHSDDYYKGGWKKTESVDPDGMDPLYSLLG